jgi:hypothetical protein
MDEIIEQVESLIARANIGVIVTMNGTDHHLINQLTRIKEALTKQKWQQYGVMQAEASAGAEGATVASEGQGEANTCAGFCECCGGDGIYIDADNNRHKCPICK